MNDQEILFPQDAPIEHPNSDQLDRSIFVDNLIRALVTEEFDSGGELRGRRSTGFVVGLTGSWGAGKSSILRLVALKLGLMRHVVVASFNPWLFKGRDELVVAFFNELRNAIGRSKIEGVKDLLRSLRRYREAIGIAARPIALLADAHGTAGLASFLVRVLQKVPFGEKLASPEEERRALERKLHGLNAAVVVLIDELDRVEDEEVQAVAQLIKAIGEIKGISYLVAYDPDRVADALGRGDGMERRQSGQLYLEKIIQHPIPLRPLFDEDVEVLLAATIREFGVEFPEAISEREKRILGELKRQISTPREIKRLVGAFAVIERAIHGEICPFDVLGYCWLLTKAPSVRGMIALHPDKVVNDPSTEELYARASWGDEKRDVATAFGSQATEHENLLKLMFPIFGSSQSDDDGNRVSLRRNLVRLLYLGNPPGMINRAEMERLWSIRDQHVIEQEVRNLVASGRMVSLLGRLDDYVPQLDPTGDDIFWAACSSALERDSDWVKGAEPQIGYANDLATSLIRLGLKNAKMKPRVMSAVDGLIQKGDLLFVPWILRKHLFHHHLTVVSSQPQVGSSVYTREETAALLDQELPRYRTAVLDGSLLRRVPTPEAIFVILNVDRWDSELKASFTSQLEMPQAIFTLAALLVPPGQVVDLKTMQLLFDTEFVASRLESAISSRLVPDDTWITESTRRLRAVLSGGDIMFGIQD